MPATFGTSDDPVLRLLGDVVRGASGNLPVDDHTELPGFEAIAPDTPDLLPQLHDLARQDSTVARLLRAALKPSPSRAALDDLLEVAEQRQTEFGTWLAEIAARLTDASEASRPTRDHGTHDWIGGYRLLDRVGAGSSSVVFRALTPDQVLVAIKILRPEAAASPVRIRFRAELEVLRTLDHSGIARLLDHGVTDWQGLPLPYLVLEFVDGMPITSFVLEQQSDMSTMLALMIEVARSIDAAHQRGVIHRDLTPGNVLVDRLGQTKVVDFGIAIARDATSPIERTRTGEMVGTLPYASPEQVSGQPRQCDARTDVYALGILMHELSVGQPPFLADSPTLAELLQRIAHEPLPRLAGDQPRRRQLQAVLDQATAKDPNERYTSAAEFADDLDRVASGQAPLAQPQSAFADINRFVTRHRIIASTVVVSAVVLALAATAVVIAWQTAAEARDRATQLANHALRLTHSLVDTTREHLKPSMASATFLEITEQFNTMSADLLSDVEDPEAVDALADAIGSLADTLLKLGQRRAEVSLRESQLKLRHRAVALEVNDQRLSDLAVALVQRADLLNRTDALPSYQRALEIDTQLFESRGRALTQIDNLIWSHMRIAPLPAGSSPARTLERLAPARQLAKEAVRRTKGKTRSLRTWGILLSREGSLWLELHQVAIAALCQQEALQALERVLTQMPNHVGVLQEVRNASFSLGQALKHAGLYAESARILEGTARYGEQILVLEPSYPQHHYLQSRVLFDLHQVCMKLGQVQFGVDLFAAADSHARHACAITSDMPRYRSFADALRQIEGTYTRLPPPRPGSWRDYWGGDSHGG